MADNRILNLDELFGQTQVIQIKWQGRIYDLRRPEALDPIDFVRYEKLQTRMNQLQTGSQGNPQEDLTEEQATEFKLIMDDMTRLLCPDLHAAKLPFVAQFRVLVHYSDTLAKEREEAKKAPNQTVEEFLAQHGQKSTPDSVSGTTAVATTN
jgi:hypothetical protein